ncbi:MAG TPA: acetate--CoA ligase family protein, partial [Candidatus Binatia bacterium]|nr:acetate--CoA ligase family protein [Candidatus Binatia bacterium]
ETVADFGNMNNPLDGTGAMFDDEKLFPRLLQALIDDANIDLVSVNLEANDPRPRELKSGDRFSLLIENAAARSAKPIATFSSVVGGPVDREILLPLRAAGVPIMEGAECATLALRNLAEYYEFRAALQNKAARRFESRAVQAHLPSGILPAEAAFRLLESYGLPVVPTVLTQNPDEAARAAERMGFPVVLKVESAQIAHKSDAGGVAVGLTSVTEVRDAFAQIQQRVGARVSSAKIEGIVVQRMAGAGIEMMLGIKRDPMFGPTVLCGFGGVLVEVLKDVALGIPPLSNEQAQSMISRLRGAAILDGVRGHPPADVGALCEAVVRLSELAVSLGNRLEGLDINPLIVQTDGAVAVDALIEFK